MPSASVCNPIQRVARGGRTILGKHAQQLALLVEQAEKVVGERGLKVAWIELAGKRVERLGLGLKVVDVEYCFWIGEIVLGQVIVEPCAFGAKVGDGWRCACGYACAGEDDNIFGCDTRRDGTRQDRTSVAGWLTGW